MSSLHCSPPSQPALQQVSRRLNELISAAAAAAAAASQQWRIDDRSSSDGQGSNDVGFCLFKFNSAVSIQGDPKIWHNYLYALNLSNINRFTKLFHCQNQKKICNNNITKIPPHLKCVTTLPCELSSVLKTNWKRDEFCNNTFQEINNRKQRVSSVSVIA